MKHMMKNDTSVTAKLEKQKNTELLQNSYAGILGSSIEPVIDHWDMTGKSALR